MIIVTVQTSSVRLAFSQLENAIANPAPVLLGIGEFLLDDAKRRFATSTAPDGTTWAVNSDVTVMRFLAGVKSNFKKNGDLSKKGLMRKGAKKPLIGQSKDLSRQMHYSVQSGELTIGNSMVYAAMQHYGGTKSQFPHLWGNIPARPFMLVMPNDENKMYPRIESAIIQMIADYLASAIEE